MAKRSATDEPASPEKRCRTDEPDEEVDFAKKEMLDMTIEFVKRELSGNDSSHDWFHIERVWRLACSLSKREGLNAESKLVVELSALLHDIKDWKYSGSDTAGVDAARKFLEDKVSDAMADRVLEVISGVGFKDELATPDRIITPELAVVQDADRLDAIGAVGIARCLTFGGSRNRVLHDPSIPPMLDMTKEQYKTSNGTTINHFFEKLLKLKDLMKTKSGKEVAEQRHEFMLTYLERFQDEWDGNA